MAGMNTFSDIIDAFGIAVVAEILGIEESHVRVMKARDSIPPEYWGVLIEQAVKRGIKGLDYRRLRRLRAVRFDREPEKARA